MERTECLGCPMGLKKTRGSGRVYDCLRFQIPAVSTTALTLRMRPTSTLLIVLLFAASLRAETPPVQGTLPEDYLPGLTPLLRAAVERSPNTILSSINLAQQEAQRYVYSYVLWPSVAGNASYGINNDSVSGGQVSTERGLFYNVGVNQPVFQWLAY